jgi:hypothetical protein
MRHEKHYFGHISLESVVCVAMMSLLDAYFNLPCDEDDKHSTIFMHKGVRNVLQNYFCMSLTK